jgi:anthranilate synthase component I
MQTTPDKAAFRELAIRHNMIPVYAELPIDLETPVSLYYKLVGDAPGFMLESADTSKNFGRYSFIGVDPFLTIRAQRQGLLVQSESERTTIRQAPLAALQSILNRFSLAELPELPPFSGGVVGYFSFEAISTWERIRGMDVPDDFILGEFLCCRLIIAMDHLTHSAKVIYLAEVDPAADFDAIYDVAVTRLDEVAARIRQPLQLPPDTPPPIQTAPAPDDAKARQQYMESVRAAKKHIAAGDTFQIVMSHPFHRPLTENPFSLYRRLRRVNPSPYMFFINFGSRQLVGASPEMLVKLQDGQVFTCPIAGTRPRGKDSAEDELLANELLTDEKERAEHSMLVDLGRNDIGRISQPGTVKVTKLMEVENFSHVMHIVSEVTGAALPRAAATDVLAACFPAGTVSGAPKIRAIEIINELEPERRGPYAGAVGYFDFRGNMDTCITIRTFTVDGDKITIQTGAGIVADSVPETEYEEIQHKARVLFQVLGGK